MLGIQCTAKHDSAMFDNEPVLHQSVALDLLINLLMHCFLAIKAWTTMSHLPILRGFFSGLKSAFIEAGRAHHQHITHVVKEEVSSYLHTGHLQNLCIAYSQELIGHCQPISLRTLGPTILCLPSHQWVLMSLILSMMGEAHMFSR